MPTNNIPQQFIDEMADSLQNIVVQELNTVTPDKSGKLKASMKVNPTTDGFEVIYETPYAYNLHEGTSKTPSVGYVMNVSAHTRRTQTGYTQVRAHTKTFKPGYKPTIRPDGSWYTSYTSTGLNAPQTKPWVQEAWTRAFRQINSKIKMFLSKRVIIDEI